MTRSPLSRHYANLTADERFPLFIGAVLRGDDVEEVRLLGSAPRLAYSVPHTFPYMLALQCVSEMFLRRRLEHALTYQRAMRAAEDAAIDDPASGPAVAMRNAGRVFGYLLGIHDEAWQRFSADTGLDLDGLYEGMNGSPALHDTDDEAATDAATYEEAVEILRGMGPLEGTVRTVESVIAEMHAVYKTVIGYFP